MSIKKSGLKAKIHKIDRKKLRGKFRTNKTKGARTMAVSKATLTCISAEVGARLAKDIAGTTINTSLITECKSIMERLAKRKGK